MLKKSKAQLALDSLNLMPSKKKEIKTCLELVRQTSCMPNKDTFYNFVLYLNLKLLRSNKKVPLSTLLELLSDDLSKEEIKELNKNIKATFKEISATTPPDSLVGFIKCNYDKEGNVISTKYDTYKYKSFIFDTYLVKRINQQLAYWNGIEYKLGNRNLSSLIYDQINLFEISSLVNEKEFVTRCFEPITDNTESNGTQIIPLQNYDLIIDKDNPGIENTKIVNKVSSRLVTNALKIKLPSNNTEDFVEWIKKHKAYRKFQLFLDQITVRDEQKKIRLAEILGNLLVRGSIVKEGALTFILGKRSSGKSTILNLMEIILGEENCCHINPNNFGERFDLQDAQGKAVDFVHESIDSQITEKAIAKLKSIVTNDPITVEAKYGASTSIKLYIKIIFACNYIPPIKWDEAFIYRIQIFPFTASFPDSSVSTDLGQDQEFLNALFVFAFEGLLRLKKNGKFSKCDACDKALEKYQIDLSPINEFLSLGETINILYKDHSGKYISKNEYEKYTVLGMYNSFKLWADKFGYYPNKKDFPSSREFKEAVTNKYDDIEIKKGNFYIGNYRAQDLVFSKKRG